jgi:hypothetical protein
VLLACEGSLIGWGTDIGGSVRIPAANQGVYGLRPSVRISYLICLYNKSTVILLTEIQEQLAIVFRRAGFYGGTRACAFCGWAYGEDVDDFNGGYEIGCRGRALTA